MLLIVEIILTVVAWHNGWKARALLPLAVSYVFGIVFIGPIIASGMDFSGALGAAFMMDILATITLAVMAFRRPE